MASPRTRIALFLVFFAILFVFFLPKDTLHNTYRSYYSSPNEIVSPSELGAGTANAAILMLVSPSRIHQATLALLNVENRFNRRLQYPYVLFVANEEEYAMIEDDEKQKIDWITQGRAKIAVLTKESWDIPDSYDMSLVEDSFRNIGFSAGYRSMCRFYAGFFWDHPAVKNYEWLWRLDTDIEFHCDIPYDPVQRMAEAGALYGFIQVNPDAVWVQPTLAGNVSEFLHDYYRSHSSSSDSGRVTLGQPFPAVPADVNHGFVWEGKEGIESALRGEAGSEEWTKMCMYNNFEISHRTIWESEIYTEFFKHLDKAGGLFYERWSDSPIHSFGVAMTLRKDQVMQFHDMGYQHQGWDFECAPLDRCSCLRKDQSEHFNDRGWRWYDAPTL